MKVLAVPAGVEPRSEGGTVSERGRHGDDPVVGVLGHPMQTRQDPLQGPPPTRIGNAVDLINDEQSESREHRIGIDAHEVGQSLRRHDLDLRVLGPEVHEHPVGKEHFGGLNQQSKAAPKARLDLSA